MSQIQRLKYETEKEAELTSTSTLPSWEDIAEKMSNDEVEVEPLLTFYRDTNGWCPFCERVWVCIRAKNIPYRERLISLQNKPEWYKEIVPSTQVPAVLFHASTSEDEPNSRKIVWESLDIMKALDEMFPDTPKLVFDSEEYKAASEQATQLFASSMGFSFKARDHPDTDVELYDTKKVQFLQGLDDLEEALETSGGPFRLGAEFSGVDAEMIPALERWRYQLPIFQDIDILDGRPALRRWFDAMDAFAPYGERAAGDKYSWTATSVMFANYFGGGNEAAVKRAEKETSELVSTFIESFDLASHEERFATEAAQKLLSNHEMIVKDCTNADPKSQQYIQRSREESSADKMLRYVTDILVSKGNDPITAAETTPLFDVASDADKADAALAAKVVASRLCVPRDMSSSAAKTLRATLMTVSKRLSQ